MRFQKLENLITEQGTQMDAAKEQLDGILEILEEKRQRRTEIKDCVWIILIAGLCSFGVATLFEILLRILGK